MHARILASTNNKKQIHTIVYWEEEEETWGWEGDFGMNFVW
jgi:hypothetical protein